MQNTQKQKERRLDFGLGQVYEAVLQVRYIGSSVVQKERAIDRATLLNVLDAVFII